MKKPGKKFVIIAILLLGIVIAFPFMLVGGLVFKDYTDDYTHQMKFDASLWIEQGKDESNFDFQWPPRLCMVDDLIDGDYLDGLAKEQVLELLGPPQSKEFPLGAKNCDMHYYLGPERGMFGIDSEWLFIFFDDADKVDSYCIYTD